MNIKEIAWRPVPDPTELTTAAVNAASDQWRRDLSSLRAVLETRLDAIDTATDLRLKALADEPQRMALLVKNLELLLTEKFRSIELQFRERDIRTDQAATASKQALDAALLAAKELVGQQNTANVEAAAKAETSFALALNTPILTTLVIEAQSRCRVVDGRNSTSLRGIRNGLSVGGQVIWKVGRRPGVVSYSCRTAR